MRFGLFIPQGWRLDLAGIPVEDHWATMRGLAQYADGSPFESVWVYDHFHTVPDPTDVISGGRVEMGIGAGWYEHEWRAYGYGFPGAVDRLGMLDEGVQIMRQLWATGTATLHGSHYQVDGAISRPLPLQAGGIPLWIAGGGERVTLRIAARYAQYTNFGGEIEDFRRKSEIL